ncbi:MAG TPA: glycosyltransferase [Patescibacteria group bacterium]|nr:glycosyltransferase [Patescibacteria group bacterium]
MLKKTDAGDRMVFFGGYDPDYPRNAIIRKGLVRCGFSVTECRANVKWKIFRRYPVLLWRYLRDGRNGGILFVPDFRHKDVPLAWLLARLAGQRCIFDPLVSRYETKVLDRGDAAEGSLQSWHNRNIDLVSFRLPDLVLTDTQAHAAFFRQQYGVDPERVRTLHIGYDDELFTARPRRGGDGAMRVLFYGTYLPLHGVDTIIEAVRLLRGPVTVSLIGEGQTYDDIRARAAGIHPERLTFRPPVPVGELERTIADSDVVLGIFGGTPKARMVIPNKVYQALAVGRAVVTADTEAVRELFTDGEHLLTVTPGDPAALARAIERLLGDPELRRRIAERGGDLIRKSYHPAAVAARFIALLRERGFL